MTSRIFLLLLQFLVVARLTSVTNAKPENHFVNILTSNEGAYKMMIRWKIESFLEMPYAKTRSFFKSEPFPDQSVNGVKWQIHLERNGSETMVTKDNDTSIALTLLFDAPRNISAFTGSCQCGILSAKGMGFNPIPSVKEVTTEDPFRFRPFVSLNQLKTSKDLLPNGHLTLQCIIDGHLMLNVASTNDVIPSLITKSIDVALCGEEIARDNKKMISNFQINNWMRVFSQQTNKQFQIVREIFLRRVLQPGPVPQYNTRFFEWHPSKEDFATDTELHDFLSFVQYGEAEHLEETCPKLYKVAEKYKFECLMKTCHNIISFKQN